MKTDCKLRTRLKIKKVVLIGLLLACCGINAQESPFSGGLSVALGGSQVDGDGYSGYNKLGMSAGVFVNYRFNEHHAIVMEMAYGQRGSKQNPNYSQNIMDSYKMTLNYIDIPVFYQYTLIFPNSLMINFLPGIMPSYLISAKEIVDEREIESNPFRKFGLTFVGEINLPLRKQWTIYYRQGYSLMGIREPSNGNTAATIVYDTQFSNFMLIGVRYFIAVK